MKAGTRRMIPILPIAFLASVITICTGCIHPRMPIRGTYTVENEAGSPFLVPSLDSLRLEGNTQPVLISLKDGPLRRMTGEHCSEHQHSLAFFQGAGVQVNGNFAR
jgi:hypothetical protein